MRVVSLVPSVTETLRSWGRDPIAVTRFCEQPDLPAVGGTKDPDVGAIVALAPDLVIVDREENRREDAEALGTAGIALHVLHVTSVAGAGREMASLARVVGATAAVRRRWSGERESCADRPAVATRLPVWVPIWRRPWMTVAGDTYAASLLGAVGLDVRSGAGGGRYPETSLDEAATLGVEWVLAPSEPYPFAARHRRELERVAPVVLVDGKDLFWWGARTPGAVERLGALARALLDTSGDAPPEWPGGLVAPSPAGEDRASRRRSPRGDST